MTGVQTCALPIYDDDPYYEGAWHKYSDTQQYPSIIVEPSDNVDALDFRPMFGMTVFIRGDMPEKMLKVYERIERCKPERVMIFNHGKDEVEILDSKGLLSGIIAA